MRPDDSPAFDIDVWHDLFVMVGGVAGALIGLLFVAVSINLDRIIAGVNLPRRAKETLAVLLAVLIISVLTLVPQPLTVLAVELLVLVLPLLLLLLSRLRQPGRPGESRRLRAVPAIVLAAVAAPLLVGALSLLVGSGGGLYWLVPAVVLGFAGALLNAWVLLVEIVR